MSRAAVRVRIALIAGTLGRGGAEKQLLLAGSSLRAAGLDARVFSLTRGEAYERELESAGVPLEHVGGGSLPPLRLIALIRALRRFRPQVVESCHTYVNLYAALAARAIGAVGIGALRSTLSHTRRANGAWTRFLLAAPSALIVTSAAAAEEVRRSMTPGRGRIFVVTNAVAAEEPPSVREITDAATVAFVGRLIPVKRLDVFLDALALARRTAPALRGLVVGDGPERARGEERAAALGLRDAVEFTGAVERVRDQLGRADFLALTSDEEGFPNVVLEAMVLGVPVVSTDYSDIRRILPRPSQVVARRAPDDIAWAILDAYGDRDAIVREQKGWARAHAGIEKAALELERVYQRYIRPAAVARVA